MIDAKPTLTQNDGLERVVFQVPASFKLEVDLEVTRRRSNLRTEGTKALAQYFDIPIPGEAGQDAA